MAILEEAGCVHDILTYIHGLWIGGKLRIATAFLYNLAIYTTSQLSY